jgi:hypothetical protein
VRFIFMVEVWRARQSAAISRTQDFALPLAA